MLKEARRGLDAEGMRLVSEVAKSWTDKYQFMIAQLGFDNKSSFHYECIFSCPTQGFPVPSVVLSTKFALVIAGDGKDPRLFFSFEESDLRHEWKLERDENEQWMASMGQQFSSLGYGSFEKYLDRIVHEKDSVRSCGVDLITSFEETRLERPPAYSEDESEDTDVCVSSRVRQKFNTSRGTSPVHAGVGGLSPTSSALDAEQQETALAMRQALQAAGLYCDKVEPPSSLAVLLANIFDAADEENAGELPHHEVARLLSGTLPGFGLELWDIYLLMTSAQENDDGFIECKPFIQAAPEIIQALRKRRMLYRSRGLPGVEIPLEAVKHCFSDEVHVIATQLFKILDQCTQENASCGKWGEARCRSTASSPTACGGKSPAESHVLEAGSEERALVGMKRRFFLDCLGQMPERLSTQEAMRLMQMLPEDEYGFISVDELEDHLEHLRMEAMLNALVESDVLSLRTHLVLRFRHLGLERDGKMRLWAIKQALLNADQVCLTRLQIHVLLCLAEADAFGYVDVARFLGVCCSIIPHMFDPRLFVETTERLIQEHAEAMRRSENEELAALGAARGAQAAQDDEGCQEKVEVDSDMVEKILQQVIALNDDVHRNPPSLPPDTIFNILQSNEREVNSTQLSTFELTGLLAEMQPDDTEGLVAYVDHIKKWIPIIFEQRKNRLLGRYLEENSQETLGYDLPDLEKLEAMFPLLPPSMHQSKAKVSGRRSSRMRENKDCFVDSRRVSICSNPPSHRRHAQPTDTPVISKELRSRSHDRQGPSGLRRRTVTGGANTENLQAKATKEPPAGRGYQRRKAFLAATEAQAAAPPLAPLSDHKAKP